MRTSGRDGTAQTCLVIGPCSAKTQPLIAALRSVHLTVIEVSPADAMTGGLFDDRLDVALVVMEDWLLALDTLAEAREREIACIALLEHAAAAMVAASLNAGADACLRLDADAEVVLGQVNAVLRRHYGCHRDGRLTSG